VHLITYRLSQADTSLAGAARLAAECPCRRQARQKVDISQRVPGLPEKYARWKVWLDGLLR
jgi:hypothetical protein